MNHLKKSLTHDIDGFVIKFLAIVAMTIDHFAWIFIQTDSLLGQSLHFFGRLTLPLICFLLVEGYNLTSNKMRYLTRLLVFAIISQVPYVMAFQGYNQLLSDYSLLWKEGNILFNLIFGLFSLIIVNSKYHSLIKILSILLLILFSTWLDWKEYVIIYCLILNHFRGCRKNQVTAYIITTMSMLLLTDLGISYTMPILSLRWSPIGLLPAAYLMYYYNGQKGSDFGGKYFFYSYYPAHLFVLSLLGLYFGSHS